MTDAERRQKLVANLYSVSRDDDRATLCYDAADEIERLAKELADTNRGRSQSKEMPADYIPIGGAGNGA